MFAGMACLLWGCDGGSGGADADVRSDGGAVDDAGVRSDGGDDDDGGAPSGDAGPAASDGGAAGCGSGETDGLGIARNCRERACFESELCIAQQLEGQGHVGFTECGMPQPITPGSSSEACMTDPPFGTGKFERRCDALSFSGEVRFFCAPDGSRVVTRFAGALSATQPGIHLYLGHEFWAGSGGGSGDSYILSWPNDVNGEDFVGYQAVEVPSSGTARLDVWFFAGDLMSLMYYAGGFSADVPPGD